MDAEDPNDWIWWARRLVDGWEDGSVGDLLNAWGQLPATGHATFDQAKEDAAREAFLKRFAEIVEEWQSHGR